VYPMTAGGAVAAVLALGLLALFLHLIDVF
jgi:hypothetical protein